MRKRASCLCQRAVPNTPLDKNIALPIIAIGGSARNIAQIHQQKHDYPIASVHGYEMTKENLDDLSLF